MKKLGLSLAVIIGFLIYSAFQKSESVLEATQPAPSAGPTGSSPAAQSSSSSAAAKAAGKYRDGTYTGDVADAFYGNVQVRTVIQNGKISNVEFIQYPNDRRTSIMINSQATPLLASEAIQAQAANVDVISGATDTSNAFVQSLSSALSQAQ